jgi:ATP-dependent 26S proteasome regulatory subunit
MEKRNLKKHQGMDICSNRRAMNEMAARNESIAQEMTERVSQLEGMITTSVNTLTEKVEKMTSRPQTVINNTTINQYILKVKEPLSYDAIEASIAMGMKPSVLRDGANGIAMYVIRENNLKEKVHITDKNRTVGRYYEIGSIDKVITDKGLTAILDHVFVKNGPGGGTVEVYHACQMFMRVVAL